VSGGALIAALALAGLALSGCQVNEYCVTCATDGRDGGGQPADGGDDGDDGGGSVRDAAPPRDGCSPAGQEICNGEDDDCDGRIDEAPVAQVGNSCGTDVGPCEQGTFACTGGALVCAGGAVNPQAEVCDGIDNDCDGTPDDGDPGGGVVCGTDAGECKRGLTQCNAGRIECVGEVAPTSELCDTLDNDCDGLLDEDNPEGGAACGNTAGTCMPGEVSCIGGTLQCVGASGPQLERCDNADNDCDMMIDEDFNLATDPRNCGSCGNQCVTPNAQPGCAARSCTIAFCFTGFHDLNRRVDDGCEYACDLAGAEVCNGRDDDCDGGTDEGLVAPNICSRVNECAGTSATCQGAAGWKCNYGPTVSKDASGDIVPETDCDGKDNDCDGVVDDFFSTLGNACTRGTGQCQTSGVIACNATKDGVACNAATPPAGTAEVCDGLDNDCDGTLDEGAPDSWVQINGSLWVYQYEASRPDATGANQGAMSHRPCSRSGRLPWTNITQPQAEAQCAAVGALLCTEAEWQQVCRSSSNSCTWGYQNNCGTYQPTTCNGNDLDFDPGTPADDDGLKATGALAQCRATWPGGAVFDMSGNLKEWTKERMQGVNPLRGGSFNNTATGLSCTFDFVVADDSFQFQNVGFRCCRSTAP
jgi:hypothetical protein